jgi:hypothetical protein
MAALQRRAKQGLSLAADQSAVALAKADRLLDPASDGESYSPIW